MDIPRQAEQHQILQADPTDSKMLLEEDQLELQLSSELKTKLAAPWKHSLILKLVGKSLGYRLSGIWRPTGNIRQLIDIGYGFYIANFNIAHDYHHALEDGPWFVGEQYLHVQP